MIARDEIRQYALGWHRSEDSLYRSVLGAPELYTSCVRLVRAVADALGDLDGLEALIGAYHEADPESVSSIADSLELPHREFLDYDLALDAAFYLRYQEIADAGIRAEVQDRLNKARSEGAEWVVLYDNRVRSRGHTFFERLEMHLPDGMGLRTSSELDWEKGRLYVVEPVRLDPATGELRRGIPPPDFQQEFSTEREMVAAVEALRARYSRGSDTAGTERGAPNG